jgi:hypothetical protein
VKMTDQKTQTQIRKLRRRCLIDKKANSGLSQAEEKELEELQVEQDGYEVEPSWLGYTQGIGMIALLLSPFIFIAMLCVRHWQDLGLPTWLSFITAMCPSGQPRPCHLDQQIRSWPDGHVRVTV